MIFPFRALTVAAATTALALCLGCTTPGSAWAINASIGVKGGFNLVHFVEDDDLEGLGWSLGGAGGGVLGIGLTDQFGLQTEVLFTRKGASSTFAAFKDDAELMFIYQDYVEVPILLKYVYMRDETGRQGVYLGPTFGFNVGSKMSAFSPLGDEVVVDLQEVTEKTDNGLALGWYFEFDWGGRHMLTGDARYTLGFTRVFTSPLETKARNSVISLMLGYSFSFVQ
jgi:hypothetical protein